MIRTTFAFSSMKSVASPFSRPQWGQKLFKKRQIYKFPQLRFHEIFVILKPWIHRLKIEKKKSEIVMKELMCKIINDLTLLCCCRLKRHFFLCLLTLLATISRLKYFMVFNFRISKGRRTLYFIPKILKEIFVKVYKNSKSIFIFMKSQKE